MEQDGDKISGTLQKSELMELTFGIDRVGSFLVDVTVSVSVLCNQLISSDIRILLH